MKKLGARPVRGLKGSMRRSIGRTRRNHASILRGHAVLQSFGLNNSEESLPPKRSPRLARCNAGGCNTFGAFDHFKCSLQNIRPETYRSKTFGSKMYRNCAPTYDSAKNVPKQNIWLENVPKLCTCKTFGSKRTEVVRLQNIWLKTYRSCAPAKHLARNVPKQNIWLETYRSCAPAKHLSKCTNVALLWKKKTFPTTIAKFDRICKLANSRN